MSKTVEKLGYCISIYHENPIDRFFKISGDPLGDNQEVVRKELKSQGVLLFREEDENRLLALSKFECPKEAYLSVGFFTVDKNDVLTIAEYPEYMYPRQDNYTWLQHNIPVRITGYDQHQVKRLILAQPNANLAKPITGFDQIKSLSS